MTWEAFVIEHGRSVRKHLLAHLLGVSEADIDRIRGTGATAGGVGTSAKSYAELFALWHGRAPADGDWPAPRKNARDTYEWLLPEMTLVASMVGTMSVAQLADVLTARLQQLAGDQDAARSPMAVQNAIQRLGLQTRDVVGGISVRQAGAEIGSDAMVYQAIQNGTLRPFRVGRMHVIPHDQWAAWKAARVAVPDGFVRLAGLREALGIKSDSKLPEFASMGYIPTAIRCNPQGSQGHSTKFGTWYVSPDVARQLLADRHAGRPMPWHGKPMRDNLQATWKLLQARRHPAECETCGKIWGDAGAPVDFEDYVRRYPPLAHGAKRHLTMAWSPGLSVAEVADSCGAAVSRVRRAIASGALAARIIKGKTYVTRTDATRWRARNCPTGEADRSWISLSTAKATYGFKLRELRDWIAGDAIQSRIGVAGEPLVLRQQCAQLRERLGYSEQEAAKRAGVSVPRLREVLEGVRWRAAPRIPHATLQAVIKRLASQQGMTVPDAARALRRSEAWVRERIEDGTVRVTRARWDARRLYLTTPMIERLRRYKRPKARKVLTGHWLSLGEAAKLAGVTTSGLTTWYLDGTLKRRRTTAGYRYHRFSVQARARRYWARARNSRAIPPAWFVAEQRAG